MTPIPKGKNAYHLALRYLGYRSRSVKEVKHYLERKGFSNLIIKQTINKLQKQAYLNDQQFCFDWISFRLQKGIGSVRLEYELNQKGVPTHIIKESLESLIEEENEYQKAAFLLDKFLQKKEQIPYNKLYRRAGSFLARRGFPQNIIKKLLEIKINSSS